MTFTNILLFKFKIKIWHKIRRGPINQVGDSTLGVKKVLHYGTEEVIYGGTTIVVHVAVAVVVIIRVVLPATEGHGVRQPRPIATWSSRTSRFAFSCVVPRAA